MALTVGCEVYLLGCRSTIAFNLDIGSSLKRLCCLAY